MSHMSVLLCRCLRAVCLRSVCLRSVCPAEVSLIKKKVFFSFLFWGGRKERWPQMVFTQGDFCPHARVHGGQPTVISRVPFTSRKVNVWICAPRGQPTVIFRASASFSVNAWTCAPRGQPTVLLRVSARVFSCECLDMSLSGNRP